jgi:hypothetical protein
MGVNVTCQFPKGDLSPQGTYGWGSLDKARELGRSIVDSWPLTVSALWARGNRGWRESTYR